MQAAKNLTVIDGLVLSNYSRSVFEDMHVGGITAANCTCCVWEDFDAAMHNMAEWFKFFRADADIIQPVLTTRDIEAAKSSDKVGIILGWQNTSGFGDNLDNVPLFAKLGLRVVQLTYNTANAVGSGCYETRDGGLTDFGRDLVALLNELGVLIDLSHVGARTSRDAIAFSKKPVAYTHCAPMGLRAHPRNKSDEQLRSIASNGGFVGVTTFPGFLAAGAEAGIDDYIQAIEYVVDLIGEERVGIGTDIGQNQPREFFEWITRDKGNGRKLVEFGDVPELRGFSTCRDFPKLIRTMEMRGWKSSRIERIAGRNWESFLKEVWLA